jgi:membrane-bound lytic murein transglycosylase D
MVTRAARPGRHGRPRAGLLLSALLFWAGETDAAAGEAPRDASRSRARAGAVGKAPSEHPSANPGTNASGEASLSQRRAVRGVPVDEGVESPELGELRRFEEQAFPRGGATPTCATDADAVEETPPSLPGRWEGTGDVPEPLRAPETTLTPPRALPGPDSDWLRSLKLPDLPVRWDPQVLRYLDYFRNDPRGRSVMGNWIRRSGRFRSLFEAALDHDGLPKDLIYVAMVESGFETAARSPVGAGGVWQFMPGAARAYGLEVGYWVDARRDPEKSVEAAARYLKDLYVRFGSWHLVFAAYNAGYGAVLKSITRYNTNDYWELCRHEAGLPWESSLYVPKILAAAIVGHNLDAFGFGDIVPDPPFAYDRVDVPAGTALATVARATSTRPEVIAALNPQIVRDRTPPDRGKYELRVPSGTASLFAQSFERSRGTGDRFETVTLRFGETLEDVAKARKTTVRELRRLNGVKDTSELRAGIAILVPQRLGKMDRKGVSKDAESTSADATGRGGPATASSDEAPDGVAAAVPDDEEILVAVPDRVFNYEGRDRVFYRTRDGDTLDDIAEAVGVRPDDLVDWNNLDPGAKLHPKMVLQIFVRKDFDPTQIVLLDPARVRVVTLGSQEFLELEAARRGKKRLTIEARAGETLARIGRRYGLTTGDLARINRFSYNTELQPGQKIVVYSPVGASPHELAQGMSSEARRDRGATSLGHGGAQRGDKAGDRGERGRSAARAATRTVAKAVVKAGERIAVREHGVASTAATRPGAPRVVVANARGDRGRDRDDEKTLSRQPGKGATPSPAPKKK